jgi:7-cyano-7-deazaguanine synthase
MADKDATSLESSRISTLISGGLDSATLIAWAANKNYDQLAFFVDYGQDNLDYEYACARINTQRYNVPLEVIDIRSLRDSFVGRFPFPLNLYDCLVKNPLGQITTYAMSALVAGVSVLADRYTMMLGIHHTDMQLRPVLQKSMDSLEDFVNYVVRAFSENEFRLLLPFKGTDRATVVKTGLELGVEYENTWSCHGSEGRPCLKCEGCEERREAFELAGVEDPQLKVGGLRVPVHAKIAGAVRI